MIVTAMGEKSGSAPIHSGMRPPDGRGGGQHDGPESCLGGLDDRLGGSKPVFVDFELDTVDVYDRVVRFRGGFELAPQLAVVPQRPARPLLFETGPPAPTPSMGSIGRGIDGFPTGARGGQLGRHVMSTLHNVIQT